MRLERAEGEAMRVERESEAECVAQEQVISSIYLCVVYFQRWDERQYLNSNTDAHYLM
jgi:hypothetical protein